MCCIQFRCSQRMLTQPSIWLRFNPMALLLSCGYWEFPKKNNSHVVDEKYFFMGPCIPSKILKRGYMAEDDLTFCQVFIIKQKLNFSTLKS